VDRLEHVVLGGDDVPDEVADAPLGAGRRKIPLVGADGLDLAGELG
jgi:hypothetical protein